MKCPNCGAPLDESVTCCPFCGTLNIPGAQKKYRKKLQSIQKDLEDLEEVPAGVLEDTFKKETRRTIKRIGIALFITLLLVMAVYAFTRFQDVRQASKEASQLAWERATFPKLDAWYASGDYDSILEFIDNPEASEYSLSRWKHASFLWAYLDYSIIHDYRNQKKEDVLFSLYALFYLDSFERMTQKEQKLVEGYRKEGENLLSQVYHMSKEALIEYYEEEYTP